MRNKTMRCSRVVAWGLFLMLGACFEGNPSDPDVLFPEEDVPIKRTSDVYNWSIPTVPPARNEACPEADPKMHGPSIPWNGFTYEGTTYTCNTCPGGDEYIQGKWRAVFDPDDPSAVYDEDPTFRESIEFEGNTFRNILEGMDLGQKVTALVEGWYFCSTKPETKNNVKFFVINKAQPDGAFGWSTGYVFTGDTLMSDANNILFGWYDGVVTSSGSPWGGTAPYCRIGQEINGIPCNDPF